MTETTLLRDLAIVMMVAAVTTYIARLLKQPVVIGYLLAGLLIGPHTPPFALISDLHSIHTMAELGLVFLMFSLGLEFNLAKLKRVGMSAALAAVLEVLGMMGLGYWVGHLFGWSSIDSLFLGAILAISSTTIIVKVFSDMGLLKEEFASVVFGILILEDIVAIVILALLSGLGAHQGSAGIAALRTIGHVGFFVTIFLVVTLVAVPRMLHRIARFQSKEMLGITALGLCLASAYLAKHLGFSVALGAFLMGSVIGVSQQIDDVEEWIHPVRDMFSAIFFVSAGLLIEPRLLWEYKGAVLVITAITIVGKIISGSLGSVLAGFRMPTSLRVGMSLAQIGEFSFVFANVGRQTGMASEFLYPLAVAVSAITTLCTPYLIRSSDTVSGALLKIGGAPAERGIDRYQAWLGRFSSGPSQESTIFSRYLLRLALYAVLYGAFLSATILVAREGVGESVRGQLVLWSVAVVVAWPLMIGIARYATHFLLLAGTQALLRARGAVLLQRLPIQPLYQLVEIGLRVALTILFLWRALPFVIDPRLFLGMVVVSVVAAWLGRSWEGRVYQSLERLLDEALGLASSEPLRLATLSADHSPETLHASMARIWIGANAKAVKKTIRSLGLREKAGASVIGLYRRGTMSVNPSPDTVLRALDVVVVLGQKEDIQKARDLLE